MIELEQFLLSNYGIVALKLEKNDESTDGNVYIIEAKKGKYVAKVYSDYSHVNSITHLHQYLINNNFYVPKIINTIDNDEYSKLGDKYVVIYSFLDGIQISIKYKVISSDMVVKIAKELRYMHDVTKYCDFNLNKLPFNVSDNITRCSLLHFDLTRSNIFINNNQVGFIDFDDAKYGKSISDVAIIVSNLFFSKTRGVDIKGVKAFIDAYYDKDIEMKINEIKYLKTYALAWISYIMDGNSFDTSTIESFKVKKELVEKYLV